MSDPQSILVLGIGNLLWADEGFGVRAVEAFQRRYAAPDHVTLLDGGTQGLYLLPHVQNCDALLIFDAVDYGIAPGTLTTVEDADVPAFMGAKKMSLHQTGFQEVLATASLLGWEPKRILLIGVQPEVLEDYGGGLTASVAAQIEPAVACAVDELARLGAAPTLRIEPLAEPLGPAALERSHYEDGRPSAEAACRIGDDRFFPGVRADA